MLPGDRIGPLRIERLVGAGGMGEVYLAHDARLDRRVAVKMLTNSDARDRMLREARAVSALRHPGIVTVYDVGEHEGRTFIAMEYVEGQTFEELVAQRGPLAPAEAVELIAQVGDALATAHDAGILHRDIKSANLMVDACGKARVLDFGLCKHNRVDPRPAAVALDHVAADRNHDEEPIATRAAPTAHGKRSAGRSVRRAKSGDSPAMADPENPSGSSDDDRDKPLATALSPGAITTGGEGAGGTGAEPQTEEGARLGTPGWAPPELMDGQPAEVRSDVFSLGAVLYHLLTGQLPFPVQTWMAVRAQVMRGPTPPSQLVPAIPPALDAVILSALAVDLDRRPANVRDLVARVRDALVGRRRRRGRWAALAVGAIAAGSGALAVLAWPSRAAHAPRAPASAAPAASAFSPPERLTATGGCAYSPTFVDRDTVVFDLTLNGAEDLFRIDLGAKASIRLTADPGWEWRASPGRRDGEVAFLRNRADTGSIETLDLASGQRTVVMPRSPAFAFSGDTLYYSMSGELRRRRGQHDEILLDLPADDLVDSMTAARDGSRLAMVVRSLHRRPKICIVEPDTGRMVCPPMAVGPGRPAFSPDASAVYFDQDDGIGRLRLAGDVHEVAVSGIGAHGGIAVSPDGRTMVWSDCIGTSELVDPGADLPRPAADARPERLPVFGPGGRFAYVRDRAGTSQLIVRDPDGGDRELVSHPGAMIGDLVFSPSGQSIAFVLEDAKEPGIYLVSNGRDGANRLTEDSGDTGPYFVGDDLVFTRPDHDRVPRLMRIHLDGSEARMVSHRPRLTLGSDWTGRRVLLASPARQWLYWWDPVTETESPGPPANPAKLASVEIIAMSPDGQWILYLGGGNGRETWRMRLDGTSRPEFVRRLTDDITATGGAIDPSGRAVVVIRRWVGDLWISRPAGDAGW